MINKIKFKNFKLFKEQQTLELRPITVLIGKNNSGKSAVAKLPTLIAGSLEGKFKTPLKWNNEGISLGQSYEDLVYNKYIADVLEFELISDDEKLSVSLYGDRHHKIFFANYNFNAVEFDVKKPIFRGFANKETKFKTLTLNYDYLGPFREIPKSDYNTNDDDFNKIGISGEHTYPLLIQLSESQNPIFNKISEWYKTNFEDWGLMVSQISGLTRRYEIALEKKGIQPINIINVGQGIHQVLPLIVRSFMPCDSKTLIIIEEPETHLHPAAHGNLAQRFAESYLEDQNKHYLIETHSQNFVLRLRRLIAEGRLKAKDLAIYFVDFDEALNQSFLRLIEIDKYGGIPNKDWPEGIFGETSIETRAIYNIRLNNRIDVD